MKLALVSCFASLKIWINGSVFHVKLLLNMLRFHTLFHWYVMAPVSCCSACLKLLLTSIYFFYSRKSYG